MLVNLGQWVIVAGAVLLGLSQCGRLPSAADGDGIEVDGYHDWGN